MNQQVAIDAWADAVISASPDLPADPATDILRRRPPRTLRRLRTGSGLPASHGDDVDAIVRAVIDLDHSYLAVQGPPGTGKTYVGSHVIARLVRERGYKIGVVAQSHAVIENMLDRVVAAGVPRELVAKAPKDPNRSDLAFTPIAKNGVAEFTAEHAASGYVVGGTAWDFAHEGRIPRGSLDLLVIDEAGQFSLASTIAVSLAASRLLLLGDPQQLPQVSQGTHPEPVDTSALGWVMDGADVIPPEYGYFLARTWRMHPRVAAPVSRLSYSGELAAHPSTALRELAGIEPGLIPVPVRHRGNATQSLEEAAVVADIVRDLVGREWTGILIGDEGQTTRLAPRPLEPSRHHRRHALQRSAGRGRRGAGGCRVPRRPGRDRRPLPRPGGGGRHRVARGLVGARRTERTRVPAAAQPPQCRDLARDAHGVPDLVARAARRPSAHPRGCRAAERFRPARR